MFARFVEGNGIAGDILFAISTSGSSPSVVLAAQATATGRLMTICIPVISFCGVSIGRWFRRMMPYIFSSVEDGS